MDYLFRNIPEGLWRKAKSKAALEGLNMKRLLILLLEAWLKGKKKDGQPCKDSTMRKFNDLAEQYLGRWDLLGLD